MNEGVGGVEVAGEQREKLEAVGRERAGGGSSRTRAAAMESLRKALVAAESAGPGFSENLVAELLRSLAAPALPSNALPPAIDRLKSPPSLSRLHLH